MRNRADGPAKYPEGPSDKPTREERGRWLKEHCPNRNEPPKKKRFLHFDQGNLRWFANTLFEIRKGGRPAFMTRECLPKRW